jgi:predicted alpha/beta superfamily hydrolase
MFKQLALFFLILQAIPFFSQKKEDTSKVITFNLYSTQLKTDKKIWVYTPKDYSSKGKKYPVIYMHDAQNLFDASTSFAGEWNIDETLDSLKTKVIIVGIEHGNEKRIDELTPYKHEKYGGGNASNYLNFIVETVKPHIEKHYNVTTNSKQTAIGGSSLGGLVSLYALVNYPNHFKKGILFSPAFWINPKMYSLVEKSNLKAKMYFLCGDKESEDMVSDMNKMISKLLKKSKTKTVVIKDGQHNEKLWREAFANAYLWLYK